MKNTLSIGTVAAALALGSQAFAGVFGTNITINDNHSTTGNTGWESTREDEETEPGTIHNQNWDLEGMFLDGTKLTLVGGYNFLTGYGGTTAGDIFIDLNGDAQFGTGNSSTAKNVDTTNLSGYDLVLDLDFSDKTFDVIQLVQGTSYVHTATDIAQSNPWSWVRGGNTLYSNLSFDLFSGFGDVQGDYTGGTHYGLSLDVSFLSGKDATFHNTMSCGNDNLMGRAHVPDAAATLSLFGAALLGLVGVRRFTAKA